MRNRKVGFGIDQLDNRTPLWAKNAFRITLLLTSVATFIIAGDAKIDAELAVQIGVYLKGLDLLVFGLSKMFGVEIEEKK